jgi:hypothetical protein
MSTSRHRRALLIALAASFAALLLACTPGLPAPRQELASILVAAVADAEIGEEIDLRDLIDGDWDRAVIFPAYQPNSIAEEELGFAFDIESTPSQSHDDQAIMVLSRDDTLQAWFSFDRSDVEFQLHGTPLGFDRDDAQFRVELQEGSSVLVPAQ